ncbi:MAG: hypothetical protein IIB53_14960 [Planctomycetes bacterium]|nr:hypothetical protein [Planctomycetota bacterium]
MSLRRRLLAGAWILVTTAPLQAEVRLPALFRDHMVLQQRTDVPIWGWALPGERIRIAASWNVGDASTTADDAGEWIVRVPTPSAGGPHQLTIEGSNTIRIEDVLIGEVWLCSGQSNMEMPVGNIRPSYSGVDGHEKEIIEADYPAIRFFDVKNVFATEPVKDVEGEWKPCTPETVRTFSATGYFFGRKLHRELGVPVGLIDSSWGGTPAEAWTSQRALRKMNDFRSTLSPIDQIRSDPEGIERTNRDQLADWWKRVANRDPGTTGDPGYARDLDDSAWQALRVSSRFSDGDLKSHDDTGRHKLK